MSLDVIKQGKMELVIKILSAAAVLLFFLPIYSFSYDFLGYGDTINISFSGLTFGMDIMNVNVPGKFGFIFVLLLPIFVLLLVQFVKGNTLIKHGISIICEIADIIIFIASTSQNSSANAFGLLGLELSATIWFIADYIILGVMLILSGLLLFNKADSLGEDAKSFTQSVNDAAGKAGVSMSNFTAKRVCSKCGAELTHNDVFCPKCGEKYIVPEAIKCPACGAVMSSGQEFCHKCGKKYEKPADKICPKCGAQNNKDMMFCGKCGANLMGEVNPQGTSETKTEDINTPKEQQEFVFCPKCGTKNDADSLYCDKCGSKID